MPSWNFVILFFFQRYILTTRKISIYDFINPCINPSGKNQRLQLQNWDFSISTYFELVKFVLSSSEVGSWSSLHAFHQTSETLFSKKEWRATKGHFITPFFSMACFLALSSSRNFFSGSWCPNRFNSVLMSLISGFARSSDMISE